MIDAIATYFVNMWTPVGYSEREPGDEEQSRRPVFVGEDLAHSASANSLSNGTIDVTHCGGIEQRQPGRED